MDFLIVWLLNALGVYITGRVVPGVRVRSASAAALAALVLGVVHAVFWKLLVVVTLPLMFLTLGLFYFVLVGLVFWGSSKIVPGFEVDGILAGLCGSFVLGLVNFGLSLLVHHRIGWW